MLNSKVLRVLPSKRRDVSGKNGIIIVFRVETINEEIPKTLNQPKSDRSSRSGLIKLLDELNVPVPESAVLESVYLLSAYINKFLKGSELQVNVEASGNPRYPWNITHIKPSNINQ